MEPQVTLSLVLVVADTFAVEGRDLLLAPDVDLGQPGIQTLEVLLKRPDGTSVQVTARAAVPLGSPPPEREGKRIRHMLSVPLPKDAVPVGTEVWRVPST